MCLYLSKRNSTYYFRRVIPGELRDILGAREFTFSLGTKDKEDAKRLRSGHALRTDRLIDDALATLAATVPYDAAPPDRVDGQWLGEFATEQAQFAARKTAEQEARRLARALHRDDWRERLDGSTERMPPRYAALRDLMREKEERVASVEARLRAVEAIPAPAPAQGAIASPMSRKGALWLDEKIVDLWAAERKPKPKTQDTHRAVARWFYKRIGRKPVDQVTRQDVLDFKAKLLTEGQTAANIKMKLSRLRTLLQWAADNGHADSNAAHGIRIKDTQAAKNRRRPFDLAALNAIFASPVFATGERPMQGRGEAAYWLPLLALFTGARMEELGQLRPSDVVRLSYVDPEGVDQHGWFINLIEVEGEDGTNLKTAESERVIPIHAELVRLGFVDFALASGEQKRDRLFHLLTPGPYGNFTHKWGQWFSTYLRKTCAVTDKRMTFHSFRHTFTDQVRRPDIPEGVQRQLVGHSSKDVHEDYGSGYNLHWLVEAIKLYKIPGLKMVDPVP